MGLGPQSQRPFPRQVLSFLLDAHPLRPLAAPAPGLSGLSADVTSSGPTLGPTVHSPTLSHVLSLVVPCGPTCQMAQLSVTVPISQLKGETPKCRDLLRATSCSADAALTPWVTLARNLVPLVCKCCHREPLPPEPGVRLPFVLPSPPASLPRVPRPQPSRDQ